MLSRSREASLRVLMGYGFSQRVLHDKQVFNGFRLGFKVFFFNRALKRVLELSEVFGRLGDVQWVVAVMVLFNCLTGRVYNRACCLHVLM